MSQSLRGRLALAVIRRRLPSIITADAVRDLPDGLHVAIAGSGSPLPDPKRGNTCAAVIAGGRVWIVDAGEGASETLNRMTITANRIEAVLLTHFHSDHIGGLGSVNLQRWAAEPRQPSLRVIGPPGVDRVIAGYNEAFALDRGYRIAHHGTDILRPDAAEMVAEPFAFPAGEDTLVVHDADGLRITAFTVNHDPATPAVGYRFDYRGRSLVISGDTSYDETLVRASHGADLLIHDALSLDLLGLVEGATGRAGLAARRQILSDIGDYHATPPQAADAARAAGVGALALTHIVPPLPLKALEGPFLGDARERFTGPLWLAEDGDIYRMPVGGEGVERGRLFRTGLRG